MRAISTVSEPVSNCKHKNVIAIALLDFTYKACVWFLTCFAHFLPLVDTFQSSKEHSVNLARARTAMNVSKSLGTRPERGAHGGKFDD